MADAFIVNAHGQEYIHKDSFKLLPGESVVMYCYSGQKLFVNDLLSEFIYDHILKANNTWEFLDMMQSPQSEGYRRGKSLAHFKGLEHIKYDFCHYINTVPEMDIDFDNHGDEWLWFNSGVWKIPIVTKYTVPWTVLRFPQSYGGKMGELEQLGYQSFHRTPTGKRRLSELVKNLRVINDNRPFTLGLFTCRDHIINLSYQRIDQLPLNLRFGSPPNKSPLQVFHFPGSNLLTDEDLAAIGKIASSLNGESLKDFKGVLKEALSLGRLSKREYSSILGE
jgi:hypothetical protein